METKLSVGIPHPKSTGDVHCLHDGELFFGPIYSIPVTEHSGYYMVRGKFCSLRCALAHALDSRSIGDRQRTLFHLMVREIYGVTHVAPAPPRECLQKHGGELTIQDFRKEGRIINLYPVANTSGERPATVVPFTYQVFQHLVTVNEDQSSEDVRQAIADEHQPQAAEPPPRKRKNLLAFFAEK